MRQSAIRSSYQFTVEIYIYIVTVERLNSFVEQIYEYIQNGSNIKVSGEVKPLTTAVVLF